jgi:hypothetical protein
MTINTPFPASSILTSTQMNNMPFGLSKTVTSTSTQSVGGGAAQDITSLTVSASLISGRAYLAVVTIACGQPATGTANLNFRVSYGSDNTEYQSINIPSTNTGQTNLNGQFYFVGAATAATTVKVQGYAVSQACSLLGSTNLHRLTIIDLGKP